MGRQYRSEFDAGFVVEFASGLLVGLLAEDAPPAAAVLGLDVVRRDGEPNVGDDGRLLGSFNRDSRLEGTGD